MKAVFTEFNKGENWTKGECEDYEFCAKLFDVGSDFGINNGRVSKLQIKHKLLGWGNSIVNYERGWDKKPDGEVNTMVYDSIMKLLENAPKLFT